MRRRVLLAGSLLLAAACAATAPSEEPGSEIASTNAALSAGDALVISQIYGGGGNAGAPFKADYVELFNRGTTGVSLAGASLQYGASGGTTYTVVALPMFTLDPGKHFLVRFASGTQGDELPVAADLTVTTNLGATAGKLLLSTGATAVACGGACAGADTVIDLVGFGAANDSEGAPAPAGSNTNALFRKDGGCTDTDHNDADFATGTPGNLHSASSSATVCGAPVDAGTDADGGADADAGDAGVDAGEDAGPGDAGPGDASDAGDAGALDAGEGTTTTKDAGRSGSMDDWVPQPAPAVGDGCAMSGMASSSSLAPFGALGVVLGLAARRRRRSAR